MALTIPNSFAGQSTPQLTALDENFNYILSIFAGPVTIGGSITAGNYDAISTNTPLELDLGGTYSATAGANPKLKLFSNDIESYGLGVSLYQLDYMCPALGNHVFYTDGIERLCIGATGGLTLGNVPDPGESNFSGGGYVSARLGSTGAGQLMAVAGIASTWYNVMIRNDGSDAYLLSSNAMATPELATNASWNAFRPFTWNLANGNVVIAGSGQATTIGGRINNKQVVKAWAYVVSGTIVASFNITSVSKPGTGRYLFTMTNALADTNYTVNITGSGQVSVQHTNGYIDNNVMGSGTYVHTTTQFQIAFINSANSGNVADQTYLSVVVFGNN